jgi:hypothetical protein
MAKTAAEVMTQSQPKSRWHWRFARKNLTLAPTRDRFAPPCGVKVEVDYLSLQPPLTNEDL